MTIPVGTLCEIVGHPMQCERGTEHFIGRFATVVGHEERRGQQYNVVHVPGVDDNLIASDRMLRPIVPPGNPDAEPAVIRKRRRVPEGAFR